MSGDDRRDVAVFFDFENIVFSLRNAYGVNANFEDLMDKCKEFGRVVVARAFADWNRHSSSMIPALMSNGFDPVYVPSFYTNESGQKDLRKNAVDMYMAIDAMDVLHTRKSVDLFILLTGDSDFLPVVNAARREGNEVIAIGVDGSSSSHLAQAVDEFIFYSQVSSLPASTFKKRPTDIYEGLLESVRRLNKEKRSPVLPNIKMKMAELLGGFDEKKHADSNGRRFQKFKEFVLDAENRGIVKLISTGSVNEVHIVDEESDSKKQENPSSSKRDNKARDSKKGKEQSPQPEKKKKKVKGPISVKQAFAILVDAVESAVKEKKSLRSSSIKGIVSGMVENFSEKLIQERDGSSPFAKFSEFTAAAEEKGLIKLVGESTHQEVWLPHMKETKRKSEPEVKEPKKKAAEAETEAPAATEAEVVASVETEAPTVSAKPDAAERQLIVDSLQSFDKYPASFLQIEAHCRQLRNERNMDVASTQIRALLTEAARSMKLLKRASARGESPTKYSLNFDGKAAATFIGVEYRPETVETEEEAPEAVTKDVAPATNDGSKSTDALVEASPETAVASDETAAKVVENEAPAVAEEVATEVETAPEPEPEAAKEQPLTLSEAHGLLLTAVRKAEADGKSLRFSAIKKRVKGLHPTFDEGQFQEENGKPFKRFSDFVKSAEALGMVEIEGNGVQAKVHSVKAES